MVRAGRGRAALALGLALGLWAGAASAQQAPLLGVQPYFGDLTFRNKQNYVWHEFVGRDWPSLSGQQPDGGSRINLARDAIRANPGRRVVLSYPGLPQGTDAENVARLRECATTTNFNDEYQGYGRALRAASFNVGNLILRVGWEWDGGGTPMSLRRSTDTTRIDNYRLCFRKIVENIRAGYGGGAPWGGLRFDFNSTTNIPNYGIDRLRRAYPGDDVVSVISVEGYDNRPEGCANPLQPSSAACRWDNVLRALVLIRDFARVRSKPMAIPEWAIWNNVDYPDPNNLPVSFDNETHVRNICNFARADANNDGVSDDNVLYYIYFNGSNNADRARPWHDLLQPANDRARFAFDQNCGSGPT